MSGALWSGRRFNIYNVIGDFNGEASAVEIDTGNSANKAVRIPDQFAGWRGLSQRIKFDNRPELTALAFAEWAKGKGCRTEIH